MHKLVFPGIAGGLSAVLVLNITALTPFCDSPQIMCKSDDPYRDMPHHDPSPQSVPIIFGTSTSTVSSVSVGSIIR